MAKIVFVVGHENWGKSKTLSALTENNFHKKYYEINDISWFIRRMSNDDDTKGYYEFMENLDVKNKPNIIVAFCPNFDEERSKKTVDILNILKNKGYNLFFWVIEHQFITKNKMNPLFINQLKNFGKIEVYSKLEEANIRSVCLKEFIENI